MNSYDSDRLNEAEMRAEHAEEQVRWLKEDLEQVKAREAKLREALERAKAAIWDSHYGHGISVDYARNVDREITEALEAK